MAKRSIVSVLPRFNMNRVVEEYTRTYYLPAANNGRSKRRDGNAQAKTLAAWKKRIASSWPEVSLRRIDESPNALEFGETLTMEVAVSLDQLQPTDVLLELRLARRVNRSRVDSSLLSNQFVADETGLDDLQTWQSYTFQAVRQEGETGDWLYRLDIAPEDCGRLHYQVRLYPYHEALVHPHETGLMQWL